MTSTAFTMKRLAANRDAIAPDGSDVRLLASVAAGSMAHFQLAAGRTSRAVAHRTVEEIWFFVSGRGEMWRQQGTREEVTPLEPGISVTIPLGTHFQFRAVGREPLAAIGITMPPWPGDGEAYEVLAHWEPHLDE